jgi:hypothetical protein
MASMSRRRRTHRFHLLFDKGKIRLLGVFPKATNPMMPIEALRLLVLGIHDKRIDGCLRQRGAVYRIPQ